MELSNWIVALFKISVAFCFGGTNALIIAMASSKGTEAGFLDSLLGNVKKSLLIITIIALSLNLFIYQALNSISILILLILGNTFLFGIYYGKKWKIPTKTQTLILSLSGFVSLVIWYIIAFMILKT